jgi:hypothetical protein
MPKLERGLLLVGALVIGCGSEVRPARPHAWLSPTVSCAQCAATPVATGTPLTLSASWSASCAVDNGGGFGLGVYWGGGDTRDTTESCNEVEFRPAVACADGACRIEDHGYTVVPTRPGTFHATVTLTPTGGGAPRTLAVDPIAVATPDRLDATCTLSADATTATLTIGLVRGVQLLYDPRALRVGVRGGAACRSLAELGEREVVDHDPDASPVLAHTYRCPVDATAKLHIDAALEGFTTSAWVTCS